MRDLIPVGCTAIVILAVGLSVMFYVVRQIETAPHFKTRYEQCEQMDRIEGKLDQLLLEAK